MENSNYFYEQLKSQILSPEAYKDITIRFNGHIDGIVNSSAPISDKEMELRYGTYKVGYLDACANARDLNKQVVEAMVLINPNLNTKLKK